MAELNSSNKKRSFGEDGEKDPHVLPVNFYGALKSKNELYFQMASLFKEVTRDEKKFNHQLVHQWMEKRMETILTAPDSDIHGKSFINKI